MARTTGSPPGAGEPYWLDCVAFRAHLRVPAHNRAGLPRWMCVTRVLTFEPLPSYTIRRFRISSIRSCLRSMPAGNLGGNFGVQLAGVSFMATSATSVAMHSCLPILVAAQEIAHLTKQKGCAALER